MNDRKRQVLLTAQRLFVEKGFATTSVQDILDESGISKGTFYNYFSSKNECLIAILEHAKDVATLRRRETLIGKDISDKDVLVEQIATRLQVNQEQNLMLLFEAVFHSKEQELRDFVKRSYLEELIWLTQRITDIYGKRAEPYAFDCAVMLLGMFQNIIQIWTFQSKDEVISYAPVYFMMRRIDVLIEEMVHSKDTLLGRDMFYKLKSSLEQIEVTKEGLVKQLTSFNYRMEITSPNVKESIQFLLDELQEEQPRLYLIEAITGSFVKEFVGTTDETEAQEIAYKLWSYIDSRK